MEFEYLSPAEIAELTEKQQAHYFKMKKAHEDAQAEQKAKEVAEKAAKEQVDKALESSAKEAQEKLEAAIKVVKDEYDQKLDEAKAIATRAREAQNKERLKGMSDYIEEALSTEEGEKALKEISKHKSGTLATIDKAPAPSMTVPAGSTRDEWAANQSAPREAVHARNVIPVSPTDATSIKYNRFLLGPDGNLINSVAPGAEKPQFEYIVEPATAPVVKIAGHITLDDEFFDDIPGSRSFIAAELPQAYMDAEDLKIFFGLGGADIEGLHTIATPVTLPKGTVTTGSNMWDKLAATMTQVRENKRVATAIWTSPIDYMELLINKGTGSGEYTYPIVMDANGILRIGGVPIYQHTLFEAGDWLAGDFSRGARIFQKKAIEVRYSREHEDNFTHNRTTVLVEARIALPIFYPDGFVKENA